MLQSHNIDVSTTAARDDTRRWEAVLRRDRSLDGQFVYAVTSTKVFCRPSCPSRRPHRDRVRFFATAGEAQQAGFRPCLRCRPDGLHPLNDAITRAMGYLKGRAAEADHRVTLAALARAAGVSTFHLQRRFKQVVGITPREYQAACRAERFRDELRRGSDVTTATYQAGYGSPSRVYDAAPTGPGMTPSTYRRRGEGTEVGFVTVRCPLGWLLVAATPKGLCSVRLGDSVAALEAELRHEFTHATVSPNRHVPAAWVEALLTYAEGSQDDNSGLTLPLDVRATAFQWRVWQALQTIPPGETRSYSDVARQIGRPSAVRAVARACATNPVCLAIPCHRVISKDGGLGGYRWGSKRKERLLAREKAGRIPAE